MYFSSSREYGHEALPESADGTVADEMESELGGHAFQDFVRRTLLMMAQRKGRQAFRKKKGRLRSCFPVQEKEMGELL